jgi:hypothetical protein
MATTAGKKIANSIELNNILFRGSAPRRYKIRRTGQFSFRLVGRLPKVTRILSTKSQSYRPGGLMLRAYCFFLLAAHRPSKWLE